MDSRMERIARLVAGKTAPAGMAKPGGPAPAGRMGAVRHWLSLLPRGRVRRRWLNIFGWPGALGVGLLAMCAAFYFSAIVPAQVRMNEARESAVSIQERVKLAAHGLDHDDLTPQEQLAEFYRIFPSEKNLLPWLRKVFELAEKHGISLKQGDYKVVRDKVGRLVRFQMNLPVRSGYPQIRQYLDSLHAEIPIVSMEHLQFERQKVNDAEIEANIRLALYLEREP